MSGIPPGVHIYAAVPVGADGSRQARILGDDARGYLIAGIPDLIAAQGEDFWFPTLEEALACGERLGVPPDRWTEIRAVSEVRMR